jgi:hypothetical protein
VAKPLRFRRSPESWGPDRVQRLLLDDLDANLGAESVSPYYKIAGDWQTRRFHMDNGDVALFAWNDDEAYWLGNTETPQTLWRTDKYGWEAVPYQVARWAQRELLGDLRQEAPWLDDYPYLRWFFLPVLLSKDGRDTTRTFFRDHAAGFPDADRDEGLSFYEAFLSTGVLDEYREVMAGKLGTSEQLDLVRMRSAMAEFTAAKILHDAGYDITPEIEVGTGHSLDFRATRNGEGTLVEVTRPLPPADRAANSPIAAIRDTAETKTSGQLSEHGGGVVLFVDCSSFHDDQWAAIKGERPEVRHRPAVVFRARPDGHIEGYAKGSVPLDLADAIDWVDR